MRKIENINDLHKFIDDIKSNSPENATVYFGVSKDGDNVDGWFSSLHNDDGAVFRDAAIYSNVDTTQITAEFIDGLETNYTYPFYIVDTGANYTWL